MFSTLHKDLTRPPGRSTRAAFCAGLAVIVVSVWLQSVIIRLIGGTIAGYLGGFFWLVLNIYMIYSLYARRLHDIGLSVGPWFAAVFITLLVIAFTMAAGGGADYFAAMNADLTIATDPERNQALIEKYQADLAENLYWARWVNLLPAVLLSLYCALKPGQKSVNTYGNIPT